MNRRAFIGGLVGATALSSQEVPSLSNANEFVVGEIKAGAFSSREFEEAVTRALNDALERGGPAWAQFRRLQGRV